MSEVGKKFEFKPVEKPKTDVERIREELIGEELALEEAERKKPQSVLASLREKLRQRKRIKITKEHKDMGIYNELQAEATRANAEYKFEMLLQRAFGNDEEEPGYPV